jgi:hypothetical protein
MFQVKSSGMYEAVIAFNLLPATYADASWIDAPLPWRERLTRLRSPGAQFALSEWLLARNNLSGVFDFDFSGIEKTMFLQRPQDLLKLAATLGLLRHRETLRMMIAGGTLARLAREIGAATLERVLVDLPSPEFLPPAEDGIDRAAELLLPQFVASGVAILLGMLEPECRAVRVRAQFKFPRHLVPHCPTLLVEEQRLAAIAYLKTYLLKERYQ